MEVKKDQFALDTNSMEWEKRWSEYNQKDMAFQMLIKDDEAGMMIRRIIYPKGYTTRWHTHTCSHGIYVLKGKLRTDKGIYGPGSFVWFPEGILMEHGATEEEDLEILFINNKVFTIDFQDGGPN